MSSNEKFEAPELNQMNGFIKTQKIKTWALYVASAAAIVWASSQVILVRNNDKLITKNERLVVVVQDLETQNDELNRRLQCRIDQNDAMTRAIGNGLVAVARGDDAALEAEAQKIVDIVNARPCR